MQVTPTSFVNVTKWTRTQTSRLLLEGGFGYYNQEYTELYQPSVTGIADKVWDPDAIRNSRVYTVLDQSNNRIANAWNAPSDHFSILRTWMGAASYVTGSHSFRLGATVSEGDWRRARPVDRRHAADHLQRRPPGPGHASPADRSPQRHQGRHRHLPPGSLDDEPRDVESGRALRLVHRRDAGERGLTEPFQQRHQVREVRRRQERHRARDASARCRTGRTSRRASAWRSTSLATDERPSRPASPSTSRASRLPWPTPPTR